ncbi:hypothetical protein CW306_00500 [Bacillus sp. BA3]|uniref:competence protein CoiA n=1 Tax=Bacillus sp. BA3 TaxID=2057910 RepID=UPI000C3276F5|nr:competence protein CoiA family protein [Bacillus sp. BA3]PKF90053.1 hypothetical protein CW306_00500 [Bacillus sp. BA3]
MTKEKEKIYAYKCNKETTKQLSDQKELYCPFCQNHVIFKSGEVYTWHFAHESNCTNKYIENESEEHEKGKFFLLEWLRSCYPKAYVESEEYIPETRQSVDVYVQHLEGELEGKKWVFEFQRSELSAKEWKERHDLYQQAGLQDFWVLDEDVFLDFSTAKGIKDARKFINLEKVIFEEKGFVYFLNIETKVLTIDVYFSQKLHPQKGRDGITRQTPYAYHEPLHHSQHLRQIQVDMDESKTHGFLFYKELETLIRKKFAEMPETK